MDPNYVIETLRLIPLNVTQQGFTSLPVITTIPTEEFGTVLDSQAQTVAARVYQACTAAGLTCWPATIAGRHYLRIAAPLVVVPYPATTNGVT